MAIDNSTSESEFEAWLLKGVGHIIGSNGRGDSGFFVKLDGDRIGFLTARHVIAPLLFLGELSVSFLGSISRRSIEPKAIRIASKFDAAILTMPEKSASDFVSKIGWDPSGAPSIEEDEKLYAVGIPGEINPGPDTSTGRLGPIPVLILPVLARMEHGSGNLECQFDESSVLPSTFGGMSGGPVFNEKRDLVGINLGEGVPVRNGRFYITPRKAWNDLYYPFSPPALKDDYYKQDIQSSPEFLIRHKDWKKEVPSEKVTFSGEAFWSKSDPNHPRGQFVKITSMKVLKAPRYPINVESFFPLTHGHEGLAVPKAIDAEIRLFLDRMNYEVVSPTRISLF